MGLQTPLFQAHLARNAKIVDFGGFDMPLHYGSQLEEHHAVRRSAGVFDVSHMCVIDICGDNARSFLRRLLANDIGKLVIPGKALYSCLLDEHGHVVDDLIAYFLREDFFRLVVNAGTRAKDMRWILAHAAGEPGGAPAVVERKDLAILAVQGPKARDCSVQLLPVAQRAAALAMPVFSGAAYGDWFMARTGYTGEDGFELLVPSSEAVQVWNALLGQGVAAAGLGARDTLRLEAGMNLYGNDMDETHHPLESGLAWTVAFEPAEREFIGRGALQRLRGTPHPQLVGLLLEGRGVLRSHQVVHTSAGAGETTSGGFAPTLNRSIALARVPAGAGPQVQVDIRGNLAPACIVAPPFVRHGKARITL